MKCATVTSFLEVHDFSKICNVCSLIRTVKYLKSQSEAVFLKILATTNMAVGAHADHSAIMTLSLAINIMQLRSSFSENRRRIMVDVSINTFFISVNSEQFFKQRFITIFKI
jgi:hypothetical protein